MTREKPSWTPIWLACECGAEWDDWQPCMVPVSTWAAHVESYHCPSCGRSGRNILMRRKPLAQPHLPGFFDEVRK
jgi:hypothetical protein